MQKIKLKNMIKLFLFLLIILIFIEVVVRIYWEPPHRTYQEGLLIKDNLSGYKLRPDFQGMILGRNGEELKIPVKINDEGLRDDFHNYTKEKGLFRILILGDTLAFGIRVEKNELISSVLQKNLKEKGYNMEVINFAVPGYQPAQEYIRYYEEGKKYNPDLVIVVVAMNDILDPDLEKINFLMDKYGDVYVPDSKIESYVKNMCQSCVLLYYLYNNRDYGFVNKGYLKYVYFQWDNSTVWSNYSNELVNFSNGLKSENKSLLVVMYPYIVQMKDDENYGLLPQKKVKDLCVEQGIDFIDVYPWVNNKEYKDYFTPEGRVANWKGHKIIAETILNYIEAKVIKRASVVDYQLKI